MPYDTSPLCPLRRHDILWITQRLPKGVREAMKKHGPNLILAGGYIRACIANEKPADIDLFTTSKQYAEALAKEFSGGDAHRVHTTENAYTISTKYLPIQIIHRWTFDTPPEVVRSFDFTIASAAVWFDPLEQPGVKAGWYGLADHEFYSDLAGKRIVYRCPVRKEEAGGSMLRVLKFYQRGYRIPLDSLGEIVARLLGGVNIDQMHPDRRTETGIAKVITGLLREVDPLTDPDHIAHLPSESQPEEDHAEESTTEAN